MFSLRKVFDVSPRQRVWYKVEKVKNSSTLYDIFFIAKIEEQGAPFICVRVTGQPYGESEFFTKTTGIKELILTDTELANILLQTCSFQYWYVSAEVVADPGNVIDKMLENVIGRVLENEKKPVEYFEVSNGVTSIAHLSFSVFSKFFESHDTMTLSGKDNIIKVLIESNMADRTTDEEPWKPEYGPTSYKPILLRLIRAEALRTMSSRHPAFITELPFAYGNFHKGYPVVFAKQNDIFFGEIDNIVISDSESGGRTAASISGIVSIRDAIKLSSVTLAQLSSDAGLTLGFDFVNPIAVKLEIKRGFDWRRCIVIDQNKIDNKLPSMEVRLSDVIGLPDVSYDWEMEIDKTVPGAFEFITQQLGSNTRPYVIRYPKVQASGFKTFLTAANVAEWEPYMRVDNNLFSDEIYSIYMTRLSERTFNSANAEIIKRLNAINIELMNLWNAQYSFSLDNVRSSDFREWSYNSVPFNMGENASYEWDKLKREYETLLPQIFTDMPGVLDRDTEFLFRVVPACSGLSESSVEDYSELLIPKGIFSTNYGDDKVYNESERPLEPGLLKPLNRNALRKETDVYEAAKAIVAFIDAVRNNVKPYVIKKKIDDPKETINLRGGNNV